MSDIMYNAYHVHSMLSSGITNIDSITNFRDYVSAAKDCGMTALGISEHGSIFEWVHKKEAIEAAGMKYLHCVEAYLTEDNEERVADNDGKKTRDNYHCVLIAKNFDGVHELNKMVSKSFNRNDWHFYYMPRISFEELFATSDNIIVTTACLGGVLHNGSPMSKERFLGFLRKNKHRCYLEIQHHNCKEQIEYNQFLYRLSKETGIPLIVGTDTHALNDEHMQGRAMLQKAKGVHFENEDDWDLTFKTPEQLVVAYELQNSLPMEVVFEAMQNSVIMTDSVEEFELDRSAKYPKLYEDSEAVFKQKILSLIHN
ncbi:MAG: PHP domain-containing protein [Prevotella sp.]|nr:PHP domain-containing protein [Prevotella sp.]